MYLNFSYFCLFVFFSSHEINNACYVRLLTNKNFKGNLRYLFNVCFYLYLLYYHNQLPTFQYAIVYCIQNYMQTTIKCIFNITILAFCLYSDKSIQCFL